MFRNFEPRHLGQIKTVYPESYELRQEKGLVSVGKRSSKYQLAIEANLTAGMCTLSIAAQRKCLLYAIFFPGLFVIFFLTFVYLWGIGALKWIWGSGF